MMPENVIAQYTESANPLWKGNPLIEALPEVISGEEFAWIVTHRPPFDPSERELPSEQRLSSLCRGEGLFIPFAHHITLYQRITRAIHVGYQNRNPVRDPTRQVLDEKVARISEKLKYGIAPHVTESVQGFALTGTTGVGKTNAIDTVFRLCPQILTHRTYQGNRINIRQLVWLKLSCPEGGSLKALCINFLENIDVIYGTKYAEKYGKSSRSASQMIPHVARIAGLVNLGVLVIDETQNINTRASQGRDVMLAFFTRLSNDLGVPIILIGTPEARIVLDGALHQVRRNSGQGEMQWDAVPDNQEWQNFASNLWRYQFVKHATPYSPGLSKALHKASGGILGFATKIFIVAQERAINLQLEKLTPELIETVSEEDFQAIYRALKNRDDDVEKQKSALAVDKLLHKKKGAKQVGSAKQPTPKTDTTEVYGQAEMLRVAQDKKDSSQSNYTMLKTHGFIKEANEFLETQQPVSGS
jgi:hypothetical protein